MRALIISNEGVYVSLAHILETLSEDETNRILTPITEGAEDMADILETVNRKKNPNTHSETSSHRSRKIPPLKVKVLYDSNGDKYYKFYHMDKEFICRLWGNYILMDGKFLLENEHRIVKTRSQFQDWAEKPDPNLRAFLEGSNTCFKKE